jgi:SAM-dependent methyltransferase
VDFLHEESVSKHGNRTVAMAREFPHAQVLGVDLAPVPTEPGSLPNNCRFEVDDINLGMDHFVGQFDLIHVRLVGSGIKDFHKSMSDVEKCLKPGGLVLWLDADYDLYSTNAFTFSRPAASELIPSGSWLQRTVYGPPISIVSWLFAGFSKQIV